MCIQTCRSSLNPTTRLNPNAHEWKPLHLRHFQPFHPAPAPPPPPPQTLLLPLAAAHPLHNQKLQMCHLPMPYIPLACSHIVYHPPPLSSPAPAPPHFGADAFRKVNGLEHCLNKLEIKPIFKERSKVVKPLVRWEWKVKKTGAEGGAAASSPPTLPQPASYSARTTVMVRNIPNQLRRDFMLEFLDNYCDVHSLKYDFMYLPMDFKSQDNLGYAFVNFTSGGDALKFKIILNNYKWGTIKTDEGKLYTSKKRCAITWARIQGKDKLLERFEGSIFACDNLHFLPAVFDPPRGGGSNATSPTIVGRLAGLEMIWIDLQLDMTRLCFHSPPFEI